MSIHQIQFRIDEQEDRLLMRVSTTDALEYRFWLTRRFVKHLWALILKMVEWDHAVRQQFDAAMRQAVLEMQHEGFAQQGDFSKGYEEKPRRFPLGEAPVLLTGGKGVRRENGVHVLSLHPAKGQGMDMTLDTRLLHIFAKLLRDAVAKSGWDLALELSEKTEQGPQAAAPAARKLN